MATVIRVYGPDATTLLGVIPEWVGLGVQEEHNQTGSIQFGVSLRSPSVALLDADQAFLSLVVDGVPQDPWFVLEEDGDDPSADTGDARIVQAAGRGTLALLEDATIYPWKSMPGMTAEQLAGLAAEHPFVDSTPGQIMRTLIGRAQARGALPRVTMTFTDGADSAGVPWPTVYTNTYEAGSDLLKVLTAMCEAGWCDTRMRKTALDLYVPDTVLGADRPDALLRLGREVLSGPRKRSRRGIKTVLLAVGDEYAAYEARSESGIARHGRREGYESQGGVTDVGTIGAAATQSLAQKAKVAEGFTVEVDVSPPPPGEPRPMPWVDYRVGEKIRYDQRRLTVGGYEPLRVRTVAQTWDEQGNRTVSLELNDLFVEANVRLARRIDGILNGSSSNNRAPIPPEGDIVNDRLAPLPPSSVSVTSDAVLYSDGLTRTTATVSWTQVTANTDGTPYNDHGEYRLSWRIFTPAQANTGVEEWTAETTVNAPPLAYLPDLPPGRMFQARVRTIDQSGNWNGAYTRSGVHTLAVDGTPPPAPSKPVITPMVGGFRASWDGRGQFGEAMPPDFGTLEVHVSSVPGFTPSTVTLYDILPARGVVPVVGLTYDTTYYVKFVALDRNRNASPPGPEASGVMARVTGGDIAAGAISYDSLPFKQQGNLIPDGSFESATYRADLQAWAGRAGIGNVLSFAGATDGSRYLVLNGAVQPNTTRTFALLGDVYGRPLPGQPGVHVLDAPLGAKFLLRARYNTTTGAAGSMSLTLACYDQAGALLSAFPVGTKVLRTADGVSAETSTHIVPPAGTMYVAPVLRLEPSATAGLWSVDYVEMRQVIGTSIIEDAAITNAQIANLAVDDAKIANLSVGKLVTGTLQADVVLGARIKTANTGARVELSNAGLRQYNAAGVITVDITTTGSALLTGQYRTRDAGERIILNSGGESQNEIRFYPATGTRFASIISNSVNNAPNDTFLGIYGYFVNDLVTRTGWMSVWPDGAQLVYGPIALEGRPPPPDNRHNGIHLSNESTWVRAEFGSVYVYGADRIDSFTRNARWFNRLDNRLAMETENRYGEVHVSSHMEINGRIYGGQWTAATGDGIGAGTLRSGRRNDAIWFDFDPPYLRVYSNGSHLFSITADGRTL